MASPDSGTKAVTDTYVGDLSRASVVSDSSTLAAPYRDSFEEDDEVAQYVSERSPPRTLIGRFLRSVGMRRRADHGFRAHEQDAVLKKQRERHSPPREVRSCRKSYVGSCLRKTLIVLPVLLLAALGVLHIAEFLVGRTGLLWDIDEYDEFLPDWGKPGHEGEGLASYPTDATRDVIPIPCHSHNDYWRHVPFYDAIHWGCTGVEADVWLFDEELYVGHNTASLTKNRTFRSLYVDPIVDLLDKMNQNTSFAATTGHGIFDEVPNQGLVLLVDFKTNGRETYPYVYDQLSTLREKDYLSYWDGEKVHSRAVTVVGTGNTPFDMILQNSTYRDIFFDAPLGRLWERPGDSKNNNNANEGQPSSQGTVGTENTTLDDYNPATSYYASVSFTHAVGFVWRGRLSEKQMNIIRGQIRGAHRRGLKARYWDTPSWPINLRNHVWHVLMQEGADILNVDDLKGAAVENWRARFKGMW